MTHPPLTPMEETAKSMGLRFCILMDELDATPEQKMWILSRAFYNAREMLDPMGPEDDGE